MTIKIDPKTYRAKADTPLLGYVGEVNARTINIDQPDVDGADTYRLRISYSDGASYDINITDGAAIITASVLRDVGFVQAQWLATAAIGDSYTLVAKSSVMILEIRAAVGDEGTIPTYEQSADALYKVLSYESKSKDYAERAESAAEKAEAAESDVAGNASRAEQAAATAESAESTATEKAAEAAESAATAGMYAENAKILNSDTLTARREAIDAKDTAVAAKDEAVHAKDVATSAAGALQDSAAKAAESAGKAEAAASIATEKSAAATTAAENAEKAQTAAETARDTAQVAQEDVAAKAEQVAKDAAQVADDKTNVATAESNVKNIVAMMGSYASPAFITPTADGSSITLEDSSNAPIQGLRIYGRSTQDGTPTPESPIDIISINNPIITISDNAENTQSVTIPHVLCGLPVSSGGNYTDNTGQQWVCDTLTVNADGNGELVQKVGLEVLSDATASIIPDSDKIFTIKKSTTGYLQGKASLTQYRLLCSHFSTSEKQYVSASSPNNSMSWSGSPAQQLRVCSTMGAAALNELFNSGNIVLQYILAAPITTPLSSEEVQSILSLHMYYPVTTVYNGQSADMSVTYVADIKTYIDNKFTELSNAVIASASEEE